jgi:hypothetical protein
MTRGPHTIWLGPKSMSLGHARVTRVKLMLALGFAASAVTAVVLTESPLAATSAAPSHAAGPRIVSWRLSADQVVSQHWQYINLPASPPSPNDGFNVRSTGLVLLNVSAQIEGAPVLVRVLDNGHPRGAPAAFAAQADSSSFSYTFDDKGKKEGCGHTFRLQWRSPTGAKARLTSGHLVVTYRPAVNDAGVCP